MAERTIYLYLSVPVCCFRKGMAREYFETEEVPPPSTVYGFLLSLVGEEDRYVYQGTRLAYALLNRPQKSVSLRTTWRIKTKSPPGIGSNRRPDYQEMLIGLQMGIWVAPGKLAERLLSASQNPTGVNRYGGLSLGESRDLINDLNWFPSWRQLEGQWLVMDEQGDLPLPIWVDHVGSSKTVYRQFSLKSDKLETPAEEDPRWITINIS
ncbi:MAG: type I-MYXAN CRISPR-associated protein Cas5/Cmx5/DevS [Desulfobacca sp.]|nr:type I-MYXAN CRISPR-associated protein Cas5/Cmx5/DevS [Desulfobacca sp.]